MICGDTREKDFTKLVSVVVSVYKAEKYLRKCVDSILTQTYPNLEILLIDDGSPDHCGEICDEYRNKDKRIRVIHNENHGVSYSRNCGIKAATGAYLLFVDSDDYVNSTYVEGLVTSIQGYDIAISDVVCFWAEKKSYILYASVNGVITHQIREDFQKLFCIFAAVWGKLYRTAILRQQSVLFDESISNAEDTLFSYEYLKYITTYNISNEAKYIYVRRQDDSLSKHFDWMDNLVQVNRIFTKIKEYLYSRNVEGKENLLWLLCMYYIIRTNSEYPKYRKRISFIRKFLGKEYKTRGIKHNLLSMCIRAKIYWPIYLYYKVKSKVTG